MLSLNKKTIIITAVALLVVIVATVSVLWAVNTGKNSTEPAENVQDSIVQKANDKALDGVRAVDKGDSAGALKAYQESYDLYKQANDTIGMAKAEMYIATAKKDIETDKKGNDLAPKPEPITNPQSLN